MDHSPYKKRRQHNEGNEPLSPLLTAKYDALANTPEMKIEPFSRQRQPVYLPEPTKIGVSYRTRRRRRYSKPGEDSDVSVISFDSGTTFGRFSQYSQASPKKRQSVSSSFQRSSTQQSSQLASSPTSASSVSRNRPYTTQSPPPTHKESSNTISDGHRSAPHPHLLADLDHLDIEQVDDLGSWTTINDVNSFNKTQQLPSAKSAETTTAKLQQQTATHTNDDRNNNEYMGIDAQMGRQTTPLPSPSTKVAEMLSDNEDEDHLDLARLRQTYKLLPTLRDAQVLHTLSWTIPEETDDMQRSSTPSQVKHQADTTTISDQIEAAPKKKLYTTKHTPIPEATDERQATSPPPSQKALGKRRADEAGRVFPEHTHQQDNLSMDMEHRKSPSPVNGMNNRSPSVLSIDYANYESDDRMNTPPIEQEPIVQEKEPAPPTSSHFNYGADAFDMYDFPAQDMETDNEPRQLQPVPRISPHANFSRKLIQNSGTQSKKPLSYIPIKLTKSLFESALPSGVTLRSGETKALAEASHLFFEQLLNDLETYGSHSREHIIDQKDMELLMSRQRLLTESKSLEALAHQHLPRDLWDELCVSALANNYLYPKQNR